MKGLFMNWSLHSQRSHWALKMHQYFKKSSWLSRQHPSWI